MIFIDSEIRWICLNSLGFERIHAAMPLGP